MTRHRVLVIGTGSIGERHVRCMQATERAQMGVCEINDELRAEVAARYGLALAFDSLTHALEHPWDAAVIASPADTHVPIALQLAEAGVPMLIEKPLSVSLDGLDELTRRIEARGLLAAVAYVYRAHPSLRGMKTMIDAGRFGKPLHVTVVSGHSFPTFRPAYQEIYFKNRRTGGGAIQDALTHLVNAVEWLVGPTERVAVHAERKVLSNVAVEDTVNMLARNGAVMACYSLNLYQAPSELTVAVVCERGTLKLELHKERFRWKVTPDNRHGASEWHNVPAGVSELDEWFMVQERAFLDALERTAEPLCTLAEAAQTLRVNLAALASADRDGVWRQVATERDEQTIC